MADSTYNNVPESRGRWLALAGLFAALAGIFTFFFSRTRRVTEPLVPVSTTEPGFYNPQYEEANIQPLIRPQTSPPKSSASAGRTFVFLVLTVIVAVILMVLQNDAASLSAPVFVVLVVGAVILAIVSAPQHIRALLRTPGIAAHTVYDQVVHYLKPVMALLEKNRALIATLSTLGALVFMIQSALAFQLVREERQPANKALMLMVYGIVAVGVALFFARPAIALPTFATVRAATVSYRPNRWLTGAGIVVLALLAEINGKMLHIDFLLPITTDQQFVLLIIGLIVLAMGLSGVGVTTSSVPLAISEADVSEESAAPSIPAHIGHYSLLVLIILIAFFARFYLLNDTMRFLIDEDAYLDATYYLEVNTNTELLAPFSGIAAFPYIFPYFESKTLDIFGDNLTGLRGASAIIGALTVVALYVLARTLFDRQTALLAALFLATFPPHIQFSRMGINEMSGPLCATLAFTFLGRGLLRNRPWHYVVGGIFLGLTHYFDEGSRLLFAPVMVAWMVGLVVVWRQSGRGKYLLLAVVTALIVALPIYYTLIGLDRPLAGRMVDNQSGLDGEYWRNLFESGDFKGHIDAHLIASFLVYTSYLDQTLFYAGDTAMLLWYVIPVVLLGLAYAIWRWRVPGMALLLIWIISVSLGNSLLTSSMSYPRFVLVFPALMLMAAVGIRYIVPLLLRNARTAGMVALSLTAVLCVGQLFYYFNDYLPLYNMQFRAKNATPDGYDAALRSLDFPRGTSIHIISMTRPVNQIEASGMLHMSRKDLYVDTLLRERFSYDYLDSLRCRGDHAFFIERNDFQTLDMLREKFYLRPAQFTPYDDLLPGQRLILFYAPYIKGSEAVYGRKC